MKANWKTTLAGIVVAVVGFSVYNHYITNEVGLAIFTIATALGLVLAKDGNTPPTA